LTVQQTSVRSLFQGPLDIIGDVHGEYEALQSLLANLGYDGDGRHPEDRRLVFVGDIIDRGPSNVSVVDLVRRLVQDWRAQCIIGNHELNLLRRQRKDGNAWFYGEHEDDGRPAFEELLTRDDDREAMLAFFQSLPLALERDDLRVVHACWDESSIAKVRHPSTSAIDLFHQHEQALRQEIARNPPAEKVDEQLIYQNRNPIKVLTSGFEERHPGFMHNGKMRYNQRATWWKDYPASGPFCVFGHYNRLNAPDNEAYIFEPDDQPHQPLGRGNCTCIDLGGGWRPKERRAGVTADFKSRLTAFRWPERELVDDYSQIRRDGPKAANAVAG
jgi:hypothetical protein